MCAVDAALRLRIHMLHLRICQVAHDIDIVCREIERDADVADTGREWAEPPGVQVKDLAKLTGGKAPLHLDDRRVESLNVPDCQFGITHLSQLNERKSLLAITGHRFFEQDIDAPVEDIRSHLKMQV